jgi:hypothetical protein
VSSNGAKLHPLFDSVKNVSITIPVHFAVICPNKKVMYSGKALPTWITCPTDQALHESVKVLNEAFQLSYIDADLPLPPITFEKPSISRIANDALFSMPIHPDVGGTDAQMYTIRHPVASAVHPETNQTWAKEPWAKKFTDNKWASSLFIVVKDLGDIGGKAFYPFAVDANERAVMDTQKKLPATSLVKQWLNGYRQKNSDVIYLHYKTIPKLQEPPVWVDFNIYMDLGYNLVHEVGHWAGLQHTNDELNGDCSWSDILLAEGGYVEDDTAAQKMNTYTHWKFESNACIPTVPCTKDTLISCVLKDDCKVGSFCYLSSSQKCGTELEPIDNFMTRGDDPCKQRFTRSQLLSMHYFIQKYRREPPQKGKQQ